MTKHTPGPWIHYSSESSESVVCVKELPDTGVRAYIIPPNSYTKKADASLIASAPELLEACKAIIDLADENEVQPKSQEWLLFQTLLKKSNAGILARAAVAKAEGK